MDIDDYINTADAGEIGTPVSVEKRKAKLPDIANVGAMGRNIYNDIVCNMTEMKAISGRIYIEVDVGINDKRWFGDDEERNSKLIIEVNLAER